VLLDERVAVLKKARKTAAFAAILILVGLVVALIHWGPDIRTLAHFGYPGVAILMFLSSSTVLFPAPGFAAVLAAGTVCNPVAIGIAAGLGAGTGEISGYLLGMSGNAMLSLKEGKRWQRAHRWLERYGLLAIVLLASIPNPFFDAIGLVAGSLNYPLRSFWFAAVLGNCLKYVTLAYFSNNIAAWWLLQ